MKITIVTPSYNSGRFLPATLDSVRQQAATGLEIDHIVVDGGSSDGSVALLEQHRASLRHLIVEPDRGPASAINKGLRLANGDIVAWLNADDCYQPGALQRVADAFQRHPRKALAFGRCRIVNEQGAFPLEATSRFGYPAFQLQTEFHCSPWADFLSTVALGKPYDLEWRPGYGIVVLVALTPFPFLHAAERTRPLPLGLRINFHEYPGQNELRHFHPEEITVGQDEQGREIWHTCSDTGYILHVSGMGASVEEARDMAYQRIDNLVIPKMFYRHYIGMRFLRQDRALLTQWGWM